MKKLLIVLVIILPVAAALYFAKFKSGANFLTPAFKDQQEEKPKPLAKYTIEALSKTQFPASQITLAEIREQTADFTSRLFYFYVDPSIASGQAKKVSGLINIPKAEGVYSVIVMFRGYIDKENYQTGAGSVRAGQFFAKNGFITLAPDFLGYGKSDMPSENPMEERFQTYIASMTLLESLANLNQALGKEGGVTADIGKVGIWGHSNGGQIALTILEISSKSYPTVLWAPVSKPFPYSILYYTDDFDDRGKLLRRVIADFEKDYDAEKYSLTNYYDRIKAPIELHQGGADEAVPVKWSDQLYETLKKLGKEIEYFTYGGEDHNFAKGSWSTVVSRNIDFYKKQFNKNQ